MSGEIFIIVGRLLAGAPSANSSNITSVESSGAIFRCPVSNDQNDCQEIPLYYEGKEINISV